MSKFLYKILMILVLTVFFLNMIMNTVFAAVEISIEKAYIEKIGQADYHLKYFREDRDEYTYVICSIVGYYDENNNFNPAYCMNKDLVGAESESYYVTIDSLLDNNKVWRVIKNGYPYKSAKELGLTSKYDAYAVTKWAIYCILGESKLEYFKAEKDDDEAVAMLKALKNLVDIGENGTEKQQEDPLSISKVGSLTEDGKYYYQEYKIESKSEFNEYEISKISGAPNGSYVANASGKNATKFSSNENFKIMIPTESIEKDLNIEITAKAECNAYVILEGKTTVTKTQNYVVTAGEKTTATATTALKINTNTASIKIIKTAEDTGNLLQGVEFVLYRGKEKISIQKTDKNGVITFSKLYPGTYTLIETATNEKYILDEEPLTIKLKYNDTKELKITNKAKRGNLKIIKTDADNKEIKIEGVEFELYNAETKECVGKYKSNENGEINIENLVIGEYVIKEVETDEWYNLSEVHPSADLTVFPQVP